MKKNNLKRGILAIALATSFVLGSGNSSFAAEDTSVSQEQSAKDAYLEAFNELKETYKDCIAIRYDYTYINSDNYAKSAFKYIMEQAKIYLDINDETEEATPMVLSSDDGYRIETANVKSHISSLNYAKSKLNGEKIDTDTLYNLTKDANDFIRNDDNYKNATDELRTAFRDALDEANKVLAKGNSLSEGEYEKAVSDLRDTKTAIIRYVKTEDTKKVLSEKIKETEEIVKNKDKYTENTYKMFDLALTSAKSIENNPNSKLEEYEESIKSLKEATEGLELKEDADKIKKALKELKAAKEEHEITVKACKMLLNYPAIEKNNGDRIRAYLEKSAKVIERANKILEHYGMN